MPEPERVTPIVCEACGGDAELKVGCFWCDRTGLMLPERLAQYRASRAQRITGAFQAYRSVVTDMIAALRERNIALASLLADEGDAIVARHDAMLRGPSSKEGRESAVQELRLYHERLVAYFTGKR